MLVKGGQISLIIPVGSKIVFKDEKQAYTVQASNERFIICNKPFNPKKTVLYTIIDLKEGMRGIEGVLFSIGAETKEQCEEMLERLINGESNLSRRNYIQLNIEKIFFNS